MVFKRFNEKEEALRMRSFWLSTARRCKEI